MSIDKCTAIKIGISIIPPVLLMLIPVAYFENAQPICLFNNIFNLECPGCGMTRAISCIFHLQFMNAFNHNRMIVVVFPLLCYLYLRYVVVLCKKMFSRDKGNAVTILSSPCGEIRQRVKGNPEFFN